MSTFGTVTPASAAVVEFVESADPADLQARVTARLAVLAAIQDELLTELTLTGGGDGHTFIVLIGHATALDVEGGLVISQTSVRCYLASESEALGVARGAVVPGAGTTVLAEEFAGSSKGTRFMGMTVLTNSLIPPQVNVPIGIVGGQNLALAIATGTHNVTTGLALGNNVLGFDSPSAGILRYIGNEGIMAVLHASISLSITTPFSAVVSIVLDPLGAPTVIDNQTNVTTAAGFVANANVHAHIPLADNDELAIQLSGVPAGGATVVSAHLLAFKQ